MALSKIYTVGFVVRTILAWLKEEHQKNLRPGIVRTFANLSVLEVAEKVSISNPSDYGKTASVTDAATNISTDIMGSATYLDSTKTVSRVSHGLTLTDIGKRIILMTEDPTDRVAITEILSITDVNKFVIKTAFGSDVSENLLYTVLSHHSSTNIDISDLKIMNITKLHSSVHKEVKKLGDVEADNIERNDFKSQKIYWYQHGETIFLVIPSGEVAGDLTLFYNQYPEKKTLDSEYFDIRDNYIPLVIARTKIMCLEHLGLVPPQPSAESPEDNAKRKQTIQVENKAGLDG